MSGGAVGALIYWVALFEFWSNGGWRPDRSHVFGAAQLVEVRVSVEMPAPPLLVLPEVGPVDGLLLQVSP